MSKSEDENEGASTPQASAASQSPVVLKLNASNASELLMKQYELLRAEIQYKIETQDTLSTYAIVGTAGVWTWLITHSPGSPHWRYVAFLPAGAALCVAVKSILLRLAIIRAGLHLARIERKLGWDEEGLGWEICRSRERCDPASKLATQLNSLLFGTPLAVWESVFWLLLIVFNIAAGVIYVSWGPVFSEIKGDDSTNFSKSSAQSTGQSNSTSGQFLSLHPSNLTGISNTSAIVFPTTPPSLTNGQSTISNVFGN